MRRTEKRSIFINLKSVFATLFVMGVICGSGYFFGTSYANNTKANLQEAAVDTGDSKDADLWKTVQMRVTAYCPCQKCCGEYAEGITASGHEVSQGDHFVAADRKYPFGTKMIIPGYGSSQPVEVLDRGGAIRGNKLDVFFASHQQALEWGVRYLDVKILVQ